MAETAALRFLLASDPDALTLVPGVVYRTLARHLIKRAGLTRAMLADIQAQLAYLDVLLAVAVCYVAGLWDDVDHLDWTRLRPASRDALQRIAIKFPRISRTPIACRPTIVWRRCP